MPKSESIAKPVNRRQRPAKRSLSKTDVEALAAFRYQLRLFLRFSEDVCQHHAITPLQYQMLLQIKGFPDREWATVSELAERLQAKHHGVVALIHVASHWAWCAARPAQPICARLRCT